MSSPEIVFQKAYELYGSAPTFFGWVGTAAMATIGALIWGAWWWKGNLCQGEIATLKQRIELAKQQYDVVQEKNDTAQKQADKFRAEVDALKEQIHRGASTKELTASTEALDGTLAKLASANNAVSGALDWLSSIFSSESESLADANRPRLSDSGTPGAPPV